MLNAFKQACNEMIGDIMATGTPGEKTAATLLQKALSEGNPTGAEIQLKKLKRPEAAGLLRYLKGEAPGGSGPETQATEPETAGTAQKFTEKEEVPITTVNKDAEPEQQEQQTAEVASASAAKDTTTVPVHQCYTIPVSNLHKDEKLAALFGRDDAVYAGLVKSMQKEGYRPDKPITTWAYKGNYIIVEGHTRFDAAVEAGLTEVLVVIRYFNDLEEAIAFAIAEQTLRRNLTAKDKIHTIQFLYSPEAALSKKRQAGDEEVQDTGKTAEKIGQKLSMSTSAVERYLRVINSGDKKLIKQVEKEEISVSGAIAQLKEKADAEQSVKTEPAPAEPQETTEQPPEHLEEKSDTASTQEAPVVDSPAAQAEEPFAAQPTVEKVEQEQNPNVTVTVGRLKQILNNLAPGIELEIPRTLLETLTNKNLNNNKAA